MPPVVIAAVAAYAGAISFTAFVFTAVVTVAQTIYADQQRRRAERQAREAYNASLQDRQLVIRSAIQPRDIVYGRARKSGQLVYAQTFGDKGQYLHLLIVLAGHECDAIEKVWFNDVELPDPDSNGLIQSGPYAKGVTSTLQDVRTPTGTSFTLTATPSRLYSVTSGSFESAQAYTQGVDFTVAGNTITGLPVGPTYVINYESQSVQPLVRLYKHLGQPGQAANADVVAASNGRWTSAHKGTGICYLVVALTYDQDVFGQTGVPNITALVRGKKLYDPRTLTTQWSDNAALCKRDYLRDATLGPGMTSAEVLDAEVAVEANACDEEVTLLTTGTVSVTNGSAIVTGAGTSWLNTATPRMLFVAPNGQRLAIQSITDNTHFVLTAAYSGATTAGAAYSLIQRRYTVNGVLSTGVGTKANLETLVQACSGSAVWVQGRWLMRAGVGRTADLTLTEDMLADANIEIAPRAARRDLYNAVTGTFADPSQGYAEVQFKSVENTTYRTADGGQRLPRDVQYPLTNDNFACQRLGKVLLERGRQALTVKLSTNYRAYDLAPSDWVQLTLARYGWTNKLFEVRERTWSPDSGITYVLRETSAACYAWNLGDATTVDLTPNTTLPSPFTLPTLTSFAADSSETWLGLSGDGSLITRARVTWAAVTDVFVVNGGRIELQWKRDDATDWQTAPVVPGSDTSALIGPLEDRRLLLIRGRAVNSLGRAGPWAVLTHLVVGKTSPPPTPTAFTVSVLNDGTRQFAVQLPATLPIDIDRIEIRYQAGGAVTWGAASVLDAEGQLQLTQALQGRTVTLRSQGPIAGTYSFEARLVDTSGNTSTGIQSLNRVLGQAPATYRNARNYLKNGSFEVTDNSATGVAAWDYQSGASEVGGTASKWYLTTTIPTNAAHGLYYGTLLINSNSTAGSVFIRQQLRKENNNNLQPNTNYLLSWIGIGNLDGINEALAIIIRCYDTNNLNPIDIAFLINGGNAYSMARSRQFIAFTTPSNLGKVELYFRILTNRVVPSLMFYDHDALQLEEIPAGVALADARPSEYQDALPGPGDVGTVQLVSNAATDIYSAKSSYGTPCYVTQLFISGAYNYTFQKEVSLLIPVQNGDRLVMIGQGQFDYPAAAGELCVTYAILDFKDDASSSVLFRISTWANNNDAQLSDTGNALTSQQNTAYATSAMTVNLMHTVRQEYTATFTGNLRVKLGVATKNGIAPPNSGSGVVVLRVEKVKR